VEAWEKTVLKISTCAALCTEEPFDSRRIDVRDLETSWALDIHEERVGLGHNLLELVGSGLNLSGSV
jgi:hypothetical protein